MNIIRSLKSGMSILSSYGLLSLVSEVGRQLHSNEDFFVFVKTASIENKPRVANNSFAVNECKKDEFSSLLAIWPLEFKSNLMHPREIIMSRFDNNIPCFVVRDSAGDLAGAMWIDNTDYYIESIKSELNIDEYFVIKNIFIKANFRNKGLGIFLLQEAIAQHNLNGTNVYISLIFPHRQSSVKLHEQVGFCKSGRIHITRLVFREDLVFKKKIANLNY